MDYNFEYFDNKTFDVVENNNLVVVFKDVSKIYEILHKKGYFVSMIEKASISKLFSLINLLQSLIRENLWVVDNKLINVINDNAYDLTFILFKDTYEFNNIPNNFVINGNELSLKISILKDNKLEFKTLIELDKEINESIKSLEEWVELLSDRKESQNEK